MVWSAEYLPFEWVRDTRVTNLSMFILLLLYGGFCAVKRESYDGRSTEPTMMHHPWRVESMYDSRAR